MQQSLDKLQNLEAELLDRPREADFVTLFDYLDAFITHHKIERPELRLTASGAPVDPPEHYLKYISEWKEDLEGIKKAKAFEDSAPVDEPKSDQGTADIAVQSGNGTGTLEDFKTVIEFFVNAVATNHKKHDKNESNKDLDE